MSTRTTAHRLQHLRQQAGRRWQALAPRERLALQLMLMFFITLGFWFGGWLPVRHALHEARANVAAEQQLQAHLRANAARLAARGQAAKLEAGAVSALLAASAGQSGVEIIQLASQPDQHLVVTVGGDPAAVVAWLETLQGAGVAVAGLSLEQDGESRWQGQVSLAAPLR